MSFFLSDTLMTADIPPVTIFVVRYTLYYNSL